MKTILAISLCLLELASAHLLDLSSEEFMTVWQAEFTLLALLGLLSNGSQRDRSVLMVFVLWFSWVCLTDWAIISAPPLLIEYEAVAFSFLVLWAIVRSYFFVSAPYSKDTVCIAFYTGTRAPFLSSVASLVGLPFSSVAVVVGNTTLRASRCGHMVLTDTRALLESNDFVLVDTKVKRTPQILESLEGCAGGTTKLAGVFRVRCITNLSPILEEIGYKPKTIFPSLFYLQCVRQANEHERKR